MTTLEAVIGAADKLSMPSRPFPNLGREGSDSSISCA